MANNKREYGTGSISQRKDGTWTARIRIGTTPDGNPKIKAFYGKTEREVKKKLKDFQTDLQKNDFVVVQKSTVESYMRNWLYGSKALTLKPKSFDRLEQTVIYQVLPYIGSLQLASVQSSDIQKMIAALKENGLSHSTIKKAYDAVNECFRTGVIQHSVQFNPALGVAVPPKKAFKKSDLKYYNDEESAKLCEAALFKYGNGQRKYRLGDIIIVGLNTGMRMAEMLSLKWNDVSFEDCTISINSTRVIVKSRNGEDTKYTVVEQDSAKTDSGIRDIYLNDQALEAMKRLYDVTGQFEYVLSTKDGHPLNPRYLDRLLRKIATHAGLPEEKIYGLHSLRHTFASKLFANGEDVKTVSELLGHSDVTITYNTYIHLIDDAKKKAVKKIKI